MAKHGIEHRMIARREIKASKRLVHKIKLKKGFGLGK